MISPLRWVPGDVKCFRHLHFLLCVVSSQLDPPLWSSHHLRHPPGSFQIRQWVAKAPHLATKTGYQRWGPRQQGVGQGPCSLFHQLLPIPSCALPVKLFGLLSAKLLCGGCLVTQEPKQIVIPNFPWTPKGQCDTFKHHTVFASNKYVNAPWFVSLPGLTFGKCSPEMAGLSFSNPAWYISTEGLFTF